MENWKEIPSALNEIGDDSDDEHAYIYSSNDYGPTDDDVDPDPLDLPVVGVHELQENIENMKTTWTTGKTTRIKTQEMMTTNQQTRQQQLPKMDDEKVAIAWRIMKKVMMEKTNARKPTGPR